MGILTEVTEDNETRMSRIIRSAGGRCDLREVFNAMRDQQGDARKEDHLRYLLDLAVMSNHIKVTFRACRAGTPINPYSRESIEYATSNPYGVHYADIRFYEDVVFTAV